MQAMILGQADYHLSKPWLLEQDLYREVSQFLAEWAKDQETGFELFYLVGRLQDRGTATLRELLTRFYVPFHFQDADSGPGRRLLAAQRPARVAPAGADPARRLHGGRADNRPDHRGSGGTTRRT